LLDSIKKSKKRIFVNAQINSSNFLYRSLDKYKNVDSIIINETELRQDLKITFIKHRFLAFKLIKKNKLKILVVTMGSKGVLFVNNKS
jgi:sugar/nucleoside kinase (ribokinase family)